MHLENKSPVYKQCNGSKWLGGASLQPVTGSLRSEIKLEGAATRKARLPAVASAPAGVQRTGVGLVGQKRLRDLVLGGLERTLRRSSKGHFWLREPGRSQPTEGQEQEARGALRANLTLCCVPGPRTSQPSSSSSQVRMGPKNRDGAEPADSKGGLRALRYRREGRRAGTWKGVRKIARREEQLVSQGPTAAEPLDKSSAVASDSLSLLEDLYTEFSMCGRLEKG